ncbi:MAG: hypothetical protein DRH26_00490 [Deltaproteobacteria bacterium]|nr:MAG: hypothetical protein DRH26_00490 [Deltaproteobacteria bacterium]
MSKEQKAIDSLKKFSDNHPLRAEQIRLAALEAIAQAAIRWMEKGCANNGALLNIIIENRDIIKEKSDE